MPRPGRAASAGHADSSRRRVGLGLRLSVDGHIRQDANTRDLIMDVPALIEFASRFYTLYPGDILYTGTPEGVGPIAPGDRIDAEIDHVGQFSIDVVAA